MNLYLLEQDDVGGYDTYDSAVVVAESEDAARKIHPNGGVVPSDSDTWTNELGKIQVKLLGKAVAGEEAGVVCASFNAG